MAYLLALDQGTTSSRAIVFDAQGTVVASAQKEFTQIFPQPGWVEHDPAEIWSSQISVAAEALARAGLRSADLAALGITNQRETALVWDRATGAPVYNAIVWQDRRTADTMARLKAQGKEPLIRSKTGLVADAYFTASKVAWILENVPGARRRAQAGELALGTVDTWLLYKLTGGTVLATDATNASRTLLYNIHTGAWDQELLDLFGIPAAMLPQVRSSSEVYATTDATLPLAGVPIGGIAGDQQAALAGQVCTQPGMAKNTYGTGCFMLMNTGTRPVASAHNLLTTVAWQRGGVTHYALEGSVFIAGALVQWLRDGLGLIRTAADIEPLARSVPDNGGVYLVPAFAGLGAPHWDQYARGTICGLTRAATAGHIARAALEAICFQVADLYDAMQADAGQGVGELRVDGGAAVNNTLMQLQADILQRPLVRPAITETTALGAAYLAGLAVGVWSDPQELAAHWQAERRFEPTMSENKAAALRQRWQKAITRAARWAEEDET